MTHWLSKLAVYLIAPIMVVMSTWFINVFSIYSFGMFIAVVVLSFFLMMVLVAKFKYDNNEKDQNKKSNNSADNPNKFGCKLLFQKEVIKEVSIYMLLALIAGTLFDFLSRMISPNVINYADLASALVVFSVFTLLLVFIHHLVSGVRWNKKNKMMIGIISVLVIALTVLQLYPELLTTQTKTILFKLHTIFLTSYAIYVFHGVARKLTNTVNLIPHKSQISPKKHLILFVSVQTKEENIDTWNNKITAQLKTVLKEKSLIEIAEFMHKSKDINHNWEMLLRAIAYHLEPKNGTIKLQQITLIASSNKVEFTFKNKKKCEQSSMEQVHHFINFLEEYLCIKNNKVAIRLLINKYDEIILGSNVESRGYNYESHMGTDFDNVEEVKNRLEYILNHEEVLAKYTPSETVIDFTGGQKSTTAAATLIAISSAVRNQYVNTNDKKEVIGYNFVTENPVQGV